LNHVVKLLHFIVSASGTLLILSLAGYYLLLLDSASQVAMILCIIINLVVVVGAGIGSAFLSKKDKAIAELENEKIKKERKV